MNTLPAQGFVMMPFRNDPQTNRFWDTMKDGASKFEYLSVNRFNSERGTRGLELFAAIHADIRLSDFCLADVSPLNGQPNLNVLTEAGVAVGAGKPLYLVARGDYDAVKKALPSDLHGQYIEAFSEKGAEKWPGKFHDLFERILRDLDRPSDPAREKPRTTNAQQLMWINRVVEHLRWRCRDLYETPREGPRWSVGRYCSGLPRRYTFTLQSDAAPGKEVKVGAFFEHWQRDGTPFGLELTEDASHELVPLDGARRPPDLRACTTDEAVDALIDFIDGQLLRFTPDLRRPTLLSKAIMELDGAAWEIRSVTGDQRGITPHKSRSRWGSSGLMLSFDVDGTGLSLRVGVDFAHWADKGRTPCWIWIEPSEGGSADILRRIRLKRSIRSLSESGAILVPVPMGGSFRENLSTRLTAVVRACQATAAVAPIDDLAMLEDEVPGTFEDDTMASAPADSDDEPGEDN